MNKQKTFMKHRLLEKFYLTVNIDMEKVLNARWSEVMDILDMEIKAVVMGAKSQMKKYREKYQEEMAWEKMRNIERELIRGSGSRYDIVVATIESEGIIMVFTDHGNDCFLPCGCDVNDIFDPNSTRNSMNSSRSFHEFGTKE